MGRGTWMTFAALVAALCVLWILSAHSQEDVTTVRDSAFQERVRHPVAFPHDAHNEKAGIDDCSACHHVYVDGKKAQNEASEGMQCSQCHGSEKNGRNLELIAAYHKLCKGCHEKSKAGPVLCSQCHARQR